ncbi:MAG: hypothetical protein LBT49_03685 [Prevotellaceae bacterium]|jgi:hypothetical protein|nr:hypothetical protein [Prevotellaceae bacterium]
MEKINLRISVMAVVAGLVMSACGGSKPISQQSATGFVDMEKNICQTMAEEKPDIRAYGSGQHFKEMTARNIAETQARGQFARAIATAMTASTDENANASVGYDSDTNAAAIKEQQNAGSNDWVNGIAEAEIRNTAVIHSTRQFNPTTKQYLIFVCLEYREGVSALATSIARKVEQLSQERKLEMNFEFEQYRDRIQAELEKKKNNR